MIKVLPKLRIEVNLDSDIYEGVIKFLIFPQDKDLNIEIQSNNPNFPWAMSTITEEQAKQLRDFLNEHYGEC